MKKREELRQNGHDKSRKMTSCKRGGNIIFRKGGEQVLFSDQTIGPCVVLLDAVQNI
jgi:hypothetical protein